MGNLFIKVRDRLLRSARELDAPWFSRCSNIRSICCMAVPSDVSIPQRGKRTPDRLAQKLDLSPTVNQSF
jgi:hypothetical protein